MQLQNPTKIQMYFTYFHIFVFIAHATSEVEENVEIPTSYEEAQVWRINFQNGGDEIIKKFLGIKKLIDDNDISLWHLSTTHMDFLVQPNNKVKVNRIIESRNLAHSVLVLDVQRKLDSLKAQPALWDEKTLRLGHRLNWKEYPTLRVIYEYFTYLAENFPSICTLTTIGHTELNNPIQMLRISNGNPANKALMIISGQHGREWSAIASALYVLDNIVVKFDQLPDYLKSVEWLFIPVLNPDGYDYTHTHDRLWRKNRRKLNNRTGKCIGVDINRNFGLDWDIPEYTVKYECHDGYSGPHAFSETETIALRNFILNTKKKPSALIDVHSYGQLLLYPWSARLEVTPDLRLHWRTARAMADAIRNTTDQNYETGVTYHKIYPATGTAIDWMYASGVSLSFGMEGRYSEIGFLAPPDQIIPAGKDLLAAVSQLAIEMNKELVQRRGSSYRWV